MGKRKYLHISYIVGKESSGSHTFRSCIVTLTNGDYDNLFELLKKDYCEKTGTSPEGLMLSILSLNEISRRTFKILNGE